ncbi:hypothetical protein [Bradyrhizobium sp. G127]|uniref:hypothetical protein n=1 Tax=Bradyrhizobium sp. G127 TaxID=2904800 RepID=UPI001F3B9FC9|nr:hypothetical protein [Bradyrhizobium sp. G127]MCF2522348.1 hypothetical protein [Bradyrhizobium sp. G127]
MATSEQAQVLPVVLTGQDSTTAAWASFRRNASDTKAAVDLLKKSLEGLGSGNTMGGLSNIGSAARMLANPYVAVAAAVVAAGVAAGVTHDKLSKIGDAADDIGVSARAIDGLDISLKKAGGSGVSAIAVLKTLQTQLDKTGRDGGYLEDLFKLNGNALTNSGKTKSVEDAYKSIAGFIQNARNETERLEIATNAFGAEAAPAMVKAIMGGATALDLLAQKSDAALDPAIKQAQEMDRLWKEIAKSGDGLGVAIRNAALPAMQSLYDKALEWAEIFGSKGASETRFLMGNQNAQRTMTNQNEIDRFYNSVGFGATKTPNNRKKETESRNDYDRALNSIGKHISLMEADAAAIGKTAGQHEELRVKAQLTDAALRAGLAITGERAKKFDELGARAKAAADNLAFLKLQNDLLFENEQLGRSALEQTVSSRLRGAGIDPKSAAGEMLAQQIRLNEVIKETQDISKDALKGFISDLRNGVTAGQAFANMLDKISQRLMDKALDTALNALIGKGISGLGGIFGLGTSAGTLTGQDAALNSSLFPGFGTGHSGAVIGKSVTGYKSIHPAYFDNAPRLHGGGRLSALDRLAPREVPFIGLEGEEVGFPDQLRSKYGSSSPSVIVNVAVDNQSSSPVSVQQQKNASGGVDLKVLVGQAVNSGIANGDFDKTMRSRYGAAPVGQRR